MARKDTAADAANPGRLKQIALTYKMTRRADKKIGLVLAAVGIGIFGVFLAIGFLLGHPIYLGILGLLLAFGRLASESVSATPTIQTNEGNTTSVMVHPFHSA